MDTKEFNNIYPREVSEQLRDKIRRELHKDIDNISHEELDYVVRKMKGRV